MFKKRMGLLLLFLQGSLLFAQESADAFLQRVSDNYAKITDYQANVRIQRNERVESGYLRYKSPNLLRLDYSVPSGQILVVSENKVEFYLPAYSVVMEQNLPKSDAEVIGGLGLSGNGLKLLRENYFVSYLNDGAVEALDTGSNERVVKLSLKWRVNAESFRSLEIAIDPKTLLIRRISGVTSLFENVRYDFTNIAINRGMSDDLFVFTPKEGQHVVRYPNFLNLQDD